MRKVSKLSMGEFKKLINIDTSQLISTMSLHAPLMAPHNCWFCLRNNPSYLYLCNSCGGATTPTRDKKRVLQEWTVFSFSENILGSHHDSSFLEAIEAFNTQERIAIRLTVGNTRCMLVRRLKLQTPFYSIREGEGDDEREGEVKITTMDWNKAMEEDRMLLPHLSNIAGKSNLSQIKVPF